MYKKSILFILLLVLFSCKPENSEESSIDDSLAKPDSTTIVEPKKVEKPVLEELSNERFQKVTIENVGKNKFRVQGQAQVFEAAINWSVEDGHYILKEGFVTADAGAPEWGNFDFIFEVEKVDANSSLTLILFEISAKDGNHKYQLPIHVPYN